jgi:heat shock protein HslJ
LTNPDRESILITMPSAIASRPGILAVALAAFFCLTASAARAQSVQGGERQETARPLEGTYWRATELSGKPTPAQDPKREAHLVFQPGGRVSGSDGCNRITGSYQVSDAITFGQVGGTQMACLDTGDLERAFREALRRATRLTRGGDRLELSDAAGARLAVFTAGAQTSPQAAVTTGRDRGVGHQKRGV